MNIKFPRIMVQLSLAIFLFIFMIEGILCVFSVKNYRNTFETLRSDLNENIYLSTGKYFSDFHPTLLSKKDIENRVKKYTVNIILLTLLISFVVIVGTLLVFYFTTLRHLLKMAKLNNTLKNKKVPRYPVDEIPRNEIGDLIQTREHYLNIIEEYQDKLEKKIEDYKLQLIHSAKLQAIGSFSSAIIHDIKNPLFVVGMNAKYLSKQNLSEEHNERIDKIIKSSDKINKLVKKIGSFGRSDLKLEKISLKSIIENSLLFVSSKIYQGNVQVQNNSTTDQVTVDPETLEQVFINLVSNAVDAMENSPIKVLEISSEVKENSILVRIRDSGPGIPKEIQKQIFSSFFTTKEKGEGTGLGLATCREIMEMHKGKIEVDSEPDQGTTFTLCFPINL